MLAQIQQQRVKHLQYEQQGAVAVLKAAAAAQLAAEIAVQTDLQLRNKAQARPTPDLKSDESPGSKPLPRQLPLLFEHFLITKRESQPREWIG